MDLPSFDPPPYDQPTFNSYLPSNILPSITAVIRLRNCLAELDIVLDLYREFDRNCEDIGIWEDNCESHLNEIHRAIDRVKEADEAARSLYDKTDLTPSVVWWNTIPMIGKVVHIQTEWLESPNLRMYQEYGEWRRELVGRELVEKLKKEFENAGDWKPAMKGGIEWMIDEMGEYARDKRRVVL